MRLFKTLAEKFRKERKQELDGRDLVVDALTESVRKVFSSVPQQVYVLDDGRDRQILISSLSSHNIDVEGAFVSFNLFYNEKNAVFLTKTPYYIHALSGNAIRLIANDMKNGASKVVRDGRDNFLWTLKVVTEYQEHVLGKKLVIGKILEITSGDESYGAAVYQNRKFWSF
ncbi:hypothetical protein PP935_gp193 [Rhizobium phage RHph_N34]|uniref:Uncharacterized protein n=1 Tax=Rhizobium phage RHph_N34 TaxID=2509586 RepID=A0A7S5UY27_9CAUD|nr:hypothetical protein PP935_gp193 [Rhizobium phage RHph_N34]QIG73968.1 hypothetical protein EVC06_193 [Rhizobium phage RHph_N34]